MFQTISRLYSEGRISAAGVRNAAERGWITAGEAGRILAGH